MSALAVIILAGGRARRMGGIAKPLLEVGGATLLERTVDAVRAAGCAEIVVAGPRYDGVGGVRWVREDPPFTGPVAGLAAALPLVGADWAVVLPADLVAPSDAVGMLTPAAGAADGAVLVDEDGREQWLTGVYRVEALRRSVAAHHEEVDGLSARRLLATLDLRRIPAGGRAADVDTWEHLREARRRAGTGTETDMPASDSRTLPPEALDAWAAALRTRFDLAEEDLPISLILDLARDVANGVARPAAPFSAFVAGLVAGRAGGTPEDVRDAVAEISRLAGSWETS